MKEAKLSPNATETFLRAEAATNNGLSAAGLPLFAGAIVSCIRFSNPIAIPDYTTPFHYPAESRHHLTDSL